MAVNLHLELVILSEGQRKNVFIGYLFIIGSFNNMMSLAMVKKLQITITFEHLDSTM
jgi:hypothetical protein